MYIYIRIYHISISLPTLHHLALPTNEIAPQESTGKVASNLRQHISTVDSMPTGSFGRFEKS